MTQIDEMNLLREEYAELATLNLGLSVENAKLREAVTTAIGAISSLPPEALGIGNSDDPDPGATHWYIRDEVLSALQAALNEGKP